MTAERHPIGYSGRRVVVTGAAGGIGRAVVGRLVAAGAEVHALDADDVDLGGLASRTRCDVSDESDVAHAADRIGAVVDALFCCAGVSIDRDPVEIIAVNFGGVRATVDGFCRHMVAGSAVAVMGSVAGLHWERRRDRIDALVATDGPDALRAWCGAQDALSPEGAYEVSKQALNLWTRRRAVELIERGVRLNCVNAGPVRTALLEPFAARYGDTLLDPFPIGRYAQADEVAAALIWLNSRDASYVTGIGLAVDGGMAAASI